MGEGVARSADDKQTKAIFASYHLQRTQSLSESQAYEELARLSDDEVEVCALLGKNIVAKKNN